MKQIISILLSTLMLLSSSGIAYAQHYCGDFKMLSKITLGEEHLSCGMAMEDTACGDEHGEAHDCCDNEYVQVVTDDDFSTVAFNFDIQTTFVAVFLATVVQNFTPEATTPLDYADYDPPPLIQDKLVLYETFLI